MRLSRRLFLSSSAAFAATRGYAQPVPTKARQMIFSNPPPTHDLSFDDITIDGHGYRVFRAMPRATVPKGGWPSIWMLDGNAVFERLQPQDLARHPMLAVIGIGYQTEFLFDGAARALDYTPPSDVAEPRDAERGRETGGAARFQARLLGALHAAAMRDGAPLDDNRKTLWGHSYGGLFTLYTLLTRPQAFQRYVPVSPSVGFGGGAVLKLLADAPSLHGPAQTDLLLMLGDHETRRDQPAPAVPKPNPKTLELAQTLALRAHLSVELRVLKGLGHGQTFAASFGPALDLAARI
ncbi:alpha/beta hydrolase [Rhodobacteraceae bacterium]|nr:alpha/beta hydrolase [Paracoccaceae bacterium]